MRKKLIFAGILLAAAFLLRSTTASAKVEERPRGLDERGPLTKLTFIHYKKENVKPPRPTKPPKTSSCYTFLSSGAKWKTVEPYLINPNYPALSSAQIESAIGAAVSEWEAQAKADIFGNGSLDDSVYYSDIYDNKNTASFGPYEDSRVIAVTIVWGYFSGPPQTRELVEWDMLFNTAYSWGDATTDSSKMDLQNIATHELGHSAGLGDLYETVCSQETMFGYSDYGETSKRDLGPGDIVGINKLY